jgi:hypothetical protein
MDSDVGDSAIFFLSPQDLYDGLRSASREIFVSAEVSHILSRCGFLSNGNLTDPGQGLFKIIWILDKQDEASYILGAAIRKLIPIQVIEQELRGFGPVTETGVLELLKYHRAVPDSIDAPQLRKTFLWLNRLGVLAYSSKMKTVRSLTPAAGDALAGEVDSIAAMVSPKTPYLNLVRLRRVIRQLRGVIWWADPHFGARGLEELAEELELENVTEVNILSGDSESVLTERSLKDFRRFQAQLSYRNVPSEWRVDSRSSRDWHDRWLGDSTKIWNIPPINTLLKNDYAEIYPSNDRPPLDDWWSRSVSRLTSQPM